MYLERGGRFYNGIYRKCRLVYVKKNIYAFTIVQIRPTTHWTLQRLQRLDLQTNISNVGLYTIVRLLKT